MKHLDTKILNKYREMVEKAYPSELDNWPVISGYSLRFGKYRGWNILSFEHTGNPIPLKIPLEHLTAAVVGVDDIGSDTELARKKLTRHLRLSKKDMLILLNPRASNIEQELRAAFKQHETLVKKQAQPAPEEEIPNPPPAPERVMQLKAVVQVQIQEAPAAEQAAPAAELPQKKKEQAAETQEQKTSAAIQDDVKAENQPNRNKVLIINGANEKMKKSMGNFLLSLGLQAVECPEAQHLTGMPEHDRTGILANIFEHCQAVVVLLTNDHQDYSLSKKEPDLRALHQAELNALYMAGVSAGINRGRTIVVVFGNPKPYSDIPGLNIAALDNSLEKRKELLESIKLTGCDVKTRGKAWHISGDFDIELKPVSAEKQPPPPASENLPGQDPKKQQIQPEITAGENETEKNKPMEKQPVQKKSPGEISSDESDIEDRIKELEAKLEALKNRGGRVNQRAVDELEKQLQAEKYRLRTIRQLANIENIKKSYEDYNKKGKKE